LYFIDDFRCKGYNDTYNHIELRGIVEKCRLLGEIDVIDPQREEICSLGEGASYITKNFAARKPSLSAISRWAINGLRGVRLESLKIGGQRVTSKEAINRFFAALSQNEHRPIPAHVTAASERVERQLVREGF
jgi:hypothetical protein